MNVAAGVIVLFGAIFQSCDGLAATGAWGAWVHPDGAGVGLASPGPLALGLALLVAAAWQVAAAGGLLFARWRRVVVSGAAVAVAAALLPAALDGELIIPRILALFGAGLALAAAPRCERIRTLEPDRGGSP